MPISALPPSTVRLLGSTRTLSSSLSVVKELLDNSIDAGATSIEVTISANTIDKIQVRDNGRGIDFDDFDSLGRSAYTSKLRSFEELQSNGGQTLGFRGEALASLNALATVKITTKTAADPIASKVILKFGTGGAEKRQPASAPVGTTVQASKLFERVPVRKQNALKESHKALPAIKRLLQTYVLALPHLKLSFKVPDEPGQDWSYSPCSLPTTREAVLQVFGHALVTQCLQVTAPSTADQGRMVRGPAGVTLNAFLPKVGCETGIVKDKGAFISVDSRPISPSQGTGKKLTAIFKKHLTLAQSLKGSTKSLTNPFIQLSIKCPAGSYDPNVSPMKDELLFTDENNILNCFDSFCQEVYPAKGSPSMTSIETTRTELKDRRLGLRQPPPPSQENGPNENRYASPDSRGTSTNLEESGDIFDDFQINDTELLEVLDNVPPQDAHASGHISALGKECQKLGSHSAACDSSNPITHATQSAQQDEAANVESTPVGAFMRTIGKVDLARKGSDTSDENGTVGLLPVQVVPRRIAFSAVELSQHRARLDLSTPAHRLEDIGRYLQPRREQPIEIALDETATSGNTPEPEEPCLCTSTRQQEIGRLPMNELTDSDLNKLREEVEVPFSSSSPELDTMQPHNGPQGDPSPPVTRRGISIASDDSEDAEEVPQRRHGRVVFPSSPPVVYGLRQSATHSLPNPSLRSEDHMVLQTPPSSDSSRGVTRPNAPFRLPRSSNIATAQPRSPLGVARQSMNSIVSHGLRQTRISLERGSQAVSRRLDVQVPDTSQVPPITRNPLAFSHDDMGRPLKNRLSGHLPREQEG